MSWRRSTQTVVAGIVVLAVSSVVSQPASADIDPCEGFDPSDRPDWCLELGEDPLPPSGEPTGENGSNQGNGPEDEWECRWELVEPYSDGSLLPPGGYWLNGPPPTGEARAEIVIYSWCGTSLGYRWEAPDDEPVITAADVAEDAYDSIQGRMPDPVVTTSPPEGVDAVVTVPVFVTVDNWIDELVETRPLGGDTVTVTATPELALDPGEPGADAVNCAGPGRGYDPAGGDLWDQAAGPEACMHSYSRRTGVEGRPDEWSMTVTVV